MSEFNAAQAKELVRKTKEGNINEIIAVIRHHAEKGDTKVHWYKSISGECIVLLEKRGFKVIHHGSIAVQKDGLYHTISWE